MSYEAAGKLASMIRRSHVPCSVVADSGHSFIVAITLPGHRRLYVFNVQEWEAIRLLVSG